MTIIEFNLTALGFLAGLTLGLFFAINERKLHEKDCNDMTETLHEVESND